MSMFFRENTNDLSNQGGSALVVAMIVMAILAALGLAALDVADLNLFISANDRDTKETFFHADSGANIGHEFLEVAIENGNATFYENDANTWMTASNSTEINPLNPKWSDGTDCTGSNYLQLYNHGTQNTFIRSGRIVSGILEGSASQIGAGYEGIGKSAAQAGTYSDFLVRSRRYGNRSSYAEVDLGWRHINR